MIVVGLWQGCGGDQVGGSGGGGGHAVSGEDFGFPWLLGWGKTVGQLGVSAEEGGWVGKPRRQRAKEGERDKEEERTYIPLQHDSPPLNLFIPQTRRLPQLFPLLRAADQSTAVEERGSGDVGAFEVVRDGGAEGGLLGGEEG